MRPTHPNILHSWRIAGPSQRCRGKPGARLAQQGTVDQTEFDLLLEPRLVPNSKESGASVLFGKSCVTFEEELFERIAGAWMEPYRRQFRAIFECADVRGAVDATL